MHELNEGDDPLGVLASITERPLEQCLELFGLDALEPAEDIDVVLRQLERGHLESERARGVGEEEPKVDVCGRVSPGPMKAEEGTNG